MFGCNIDSKKVSVNPVERSEPAGAKGPGFHIPHKDQSLNAGSLGRGISFSQDNRKLIAEVFLPSALSVAGGINPSFLIGYLCGTSQLSSPEAIKRP